jgi:hypothetical protein
VTPLTTVAFEETGELRDVLRYCARCATGFEGGEEVEIVSPTGVAHCERGDERTKCGIDATGPEWWWRL